MSLDDAACFAHAASRKLIARDFSCYTPPFAHGHLYVALSRITHFSNINFVLSPDQLFDGAPMVLNTTYPELL